MKTKLSYDTCPVCFTKMTGFTTLFCPNEEKHNKRGSAASSLNKLFIITHEQIISNEICGRPGLHVFDSLYKARNDQLMSSYHAITKPKYTAIYEFELTEEERTKWIVKNVSVFAIGEFNDYILGIPGNLVEEL